MEFTYKDYSITLVLNPTDFILKFENNTNHRIYERVFFDRDFGEWIVLGGIEFIEKMLEGCFKQTSSDICISSFTASQAEVSFKVTYKSPILPRTLELSFTIPASRISSTTPDSEAISKKLKESMLEMEKKFNSILERVKELEERCGDTITLPGCDYAIPTNITSLTLVRNGSEIEINSTTSQFISSFYPGFALKRDISASYINPTKELPNGTYSCTGSIIQFPPWEQIPNCYVFNTLTDIKNLKYLKNCSSLTIIGAKELQNIVHAKLDIWKKNDYQVIGEMKQLNYLRILPASKINWTTNGHQIVRDGSVSLSDISWIRNLTNLKTVSFLGCTHLVDVTPLRDLPYLTSLDIRETGVKNTDFLMNSKLTITKT